MSRVIHAPYDALTPFDLRVQTFRVNMELTTHYHKLTRKKIFEPKSYFWTFKKSFLAKMGIKKSLLDHFWSSTYQKMIKKPKTDDSYVLGRIPRKMKTWPFRKSMDKN